jgi:SAM-dependent methyltransferase
MISVKPEWFSTEAEPINDFVQVVESYHRFHPRVQFLKTLRPNAKLLDVGAGDGNLPLFSDWLAPKRTDLSFYAYALTQSENFKNYADFEIGRWPETKPKFPNIEFDAIFSAHFIEHISNPLDFITWCMERLSAEGRLYLEWPSQNSTIQPKVSDFHKVGVPLTISNFYDDDSHQQMPPNIAVLMDAMGRLGGSIDQQGVITNPLFEEEVLAHFSKKSFDKSVGSIRRRMRSFFSKPTDPSFALTMAYWSKTRWAQFIVITKI